MVTAGPEPSAAQVQMELPAQQDLLAEAVEAARGRRNLTSGRTTRAAGITLTPSRPRGLQAEEGAAQPPAQGAEVQQEAGHLQSFSPETSCRQDMSKALTERQAATVGPVLL